jgi:1,4-dihydroxy-2-naphthoyl-CoA synthase
VTDSTTSPGGRAYTEIAYRAEKGIATMPLDRPGKLNAFTGVMMSEIIDDCDQADDDDSVRAASSPAVAGHSAPAPICPAAARPSTPMVTRSAPARPT